MPNNESDILFDDLDTLRSVGDELPDLTLEAYHNNTVKKISLRDLGEKWLVLMFYPGDFTFVCPTELSELGELYPQFQKLNTEVLSVSTDSVWVHKAWHDTSAVIKNITFPMLADPNAKLSNLLNVYIEETGEARRGSFIIDPAGIIKTAEINDNAIGRSAGELFRKLQAAQFVAQHGDKVCPASWKPGDDTLEPGLDLVGKI